VIYGGSAGCGKSRGLLMWAASDADNPLMRAVIFRRTTPEIRKPGGLWDESKDLYSYLRPHPVDQFLEHRFPSGSYVKFDHLEYDKTVTDWDSSQIPKIGFDQLEQFSRYQFFYMLSRNRSMSGISAQVRGACNPDADSWLAEFLSWWIDQREKLDDGERNPRYGLPILERSGVPRWFVRDGDAIVWADTRAELVTKFGEDSHPTSVTFIPGTIYDNPILLAGNPQYLARLKALPRVERERLLGGNWKIRARAGMLFRREWCEVVDMLPPGCELVRGWDRAATPKTETNDPDWTVGAKLARDRAGVYYICGDLRMRDSAGKVKRAIVNTATADGIACRVAIRQDPGQAGKSQAEDDIRELDGFTIWQKIESGDKVVRFSPFSSQAEHGNVKILRGACSEEFLSSLEAFPEAAHDDDPDAVSTAYDALNDARGQGLRDFIREQSEALKAAQERAAGRGNGSGNGKDHAAPTGLNGGAAALMEVAQ